MEHNETWIEYCESRLGKPRQAMQFVDVAPWQAVELLFEWHPVFTDRREAISAVSYDTAFDDEADAALLRMAREDSLRGWQTMSLGAWRVLFERLLYAETLMLVNVKAETPSIGPLPLGLSKRHAARALGLVLLLGGARTIDRRLLPSIQPGTLPDLPASTTLRPQ